MPENLQLWKEKNPQHRKFRILDPLYQPGEDRLAQAMAELCIEQIKSAGFEKPAVAMVDHGTPLPEVNQVREDVGEDMRQRLGSKYLGFPPVPWNAARSHYDFNDPLLENLLARWVADGVKEIVISQFFLLPGRHAGSQWGSCGNLPTV